MADEDANDSFDSVVPLPPPFSQFLLDSPCMAPCMTHQPSTPTLSVNQELVERKRVINYEREAKRWDRVRMEEKFEDIKLQELKESQVRIARFPNPGTVLSLSW